MSIHSLSRSACANGWRAPCTPRFSCLATARHLKMPAPFRTALRPLYTILLLLFDPHPSPTPPALSPALLSFSSYFLPSSPPTSLLDSLFGLCPSRQPSTTAPRHLSLAPRSARIAVDEAHCCSAQGHDFRPDYLSLATLRDTFPSVPILALTATASAAVSGEVRTILHMGRPLPGGRVSEFRGHFDRTNLRYEVPDVFHE